MPGLAWFQLRRRTACRFRLGEAGARCGKKPPWTLPFAKKQLCINLQGMHKCIHVDLQWSMYSYILSGALKQSIPAYSKSCFLIEIPQSNKHYQPTLTNTQQEIVHSLKHVAMYSWKSIHTTELVPVRRIQQQFVLHPVLISWESASLSWTGHHVETPMPKTPFQVELGWHEVRPLTEKTTWWFIPLSKWVSSPQL